MTGWGESPVTKAHHQKIHDKIQDTFFKNTGRFTGQIGAYFARENITIS